MKPATAEELLRRSEVTPLVRSTRNQLEIDYLPPYGDPEVNLLGEFTTYLVVSAVVVELLDRIK